MNEVLCNCILIPVRVITSVKVWTGMSLERLPDRQVALPVANRSSISMETIDGNHCDALQVVLLKEPLLQRQPDGLHFFNYQPRRAQVFRILTHLILEGDMMPGFQP